MAEVCALAKRDLKAGETLDFIGETCYRSWAMKADEALEQGALPVGLLDKGKVLNDIPKGSLITRHDVDVRTDTPLYRLRQQQDDWLGIKRCA